jgi:tetratricopeptide (TPR) repeat protein
MALYRWKIALSLYPADMEIPKKIADLKKKMEGGGDRHFKEGVSFFKDNDFEKARQEFLIALRYNPDHQDALHYLKNKSPDKDIIIYTVKKADTLKKIARKVYKDSSTDFLIAWFNDLDANARLTRGTTLRLPPLEETFVRPVIEAKHRPVIKKPKPRVPVLEEPIETPDFKTIIPEPATDVKKELFKARSFIESGNYTKALRILAVILEKDPGNKEAGDLANGAYFQMGKIFMERRDYITSLSMFKNVSTDYDGLKQALDDLNRLLMDMAEEHYRRGVNFFINDELEWAINQWKEALVLNPDHPKAQQDIKNAKMLLKKLDEL